MFSLVGSGYSGFVAACRMSIVGVKVRLLEKSRRWKAQDFPTDSWEIMKAVRYEHGCKKYTKNKYNVKINIFNPLSTQTISNFMCTYSCMIDPTAQDLRKKIESDR